MTADAFSCDEIGARELLPRYVATTLGDTDVVALEEHLVECARCQREIELAASVARGVQALPRAATAVRRSWRLPAVAAAATIAGVLLLSLRRQRADQTEPLGDAPAYGAMAVRGTGGVRTGDSLFAHAMTRYAAREYHAASDDLRAALNGGASTAPAAFFLGVSLLFDSRPEDARDALSRVIALGDTPYVAEAHFYRALASLRLRDPASARRDLVSAALSDTPIAARARARLAQMGDPTSR